ncbi:hypothetical protein [Nocardia transvalensis]|uniref:hypothetical protein n=1 Tax=Nocardia transvalensis TaxID=37333 RepID=UPI001893E3CB|nr:hypothetical protein [Nocardia transvalensis]MBF6331856.1 hypothetical protein [Nocardia transvalensis]
MRDADNRQSAAAALWDPRQLSHETWRQIGIDPATLSSDIGGLDHVDGFKRCGGYDGARTYLVDVWAQIYTVTDFQRKKIGADFVPVTIDHRSGLGYRPAFRPADHYSLVFPSIHGSYSVEVLRVDPRSQVEPRDHAIKVAKIVVPLLPE